MQIISEAAKRQLPRVFADIAVGLLVIFGSLGLALSGYPGGAAATVAVGFCYLLVRGVRTWILFLKKRDQPNSGSEIEKSN